MGYPTPEKTWVVTEVIGDLTGTRVNDIKSLVWQVKEALKALGWTVAGSNDNTTAGMDAVDRWDAYTDITNSGNDGDSWIVLEAPAGWGNGQLRLNMNNGGAFGILVRTEFSLGGLYTGGNTTTLPTATDGDGLVNNELFDFNIGSGGAQITAYILSSTDGEHFRIFFCSNGEPTGFLLFETAGNPGGAWDGRFYGRGPVFIRGESPQIGLNATISNGNRRHLRIKKPAANTFGYLNYVMPITAGRQIFDTTFTLPNPNEISGDYTLFPMELYNWDTVGLRGKVGYIKDWWFTFFAANRGDNYPDDDSLQFMVMSAAFVMPWDGSTIPNFGGS